MSERSRPRRRRSATRMSTRTILIIVNLVAIAGVLGFIAYRVISLRRNPEREDPREPHAVLRRRRARGRAPRARARRRARSRSVIVVLGLLALLHLGAVPRGVGARPASRSARSSAARCSSPTTSREAYDSTKSLLCANCHGVDGGGGVGAVRGQERGPALRPEPDGRRRARRRAARTACPSRCRGAAPNLQLARLRYDREQLTQIITYGRPGTPMPAWGVAERQGRAQRAEHPGPRQLRGEHHHHARQGAGAWPRPRRRATRKDARRRR